MNVRKRGLALLMCICMIFTLLPFSAFADGTSEPDVVYGTYDNGPWTQDANAKDTVTKTVDNQGNTVTLKKTATPTGNENEYKIDLEVITTETSSTKAGDAATVLVIDVSGSMGDCATCGNEKGLTHKFTYGHAFESRIAAAQAAAKQFIDAFKSDNARRYVSVVSFSTDSRVACEWMDVSTVAGYKAVKEAIDGLEAKGGTNLDAGLQTANTQLSKTTVASIKANAKNVIALTDGMPTFYVGGDGKNGNHGSTGCPITNDRTEASATTLKNSAALYTVCFGAASDKCWSDWVYNKRDKTYEYGIWPNIIICSDPSHAQDGPTVGDFLSGSIATPAADGKTYAYNADKTKDLLAAFKSITDTITEGISAGTVKDGLPTGVSLVGSAPTAFVENTDGTYSWELIPANAEKGTDGGKTTYTYKVSYVVELDTTDPEFNEDIYHALNTETTFTAGGKVYNFNVPGVKGTAPKYKVTYEFEGNHPDSVAVPASEQHKAGENVKMPEITAPEGWIFNGWKYDSEPVTSVEMPAGDITIIGTFTEQKAYTVKYLLKGTDISVKDAVTGIKNVGDSVSAVAPDLTGYTFAGADADKNQTITVTSDASQNVITFYYYKNVTVTAKNDTKVYGNDDPAAFAADVTGTRDNETVVYTVARGDGEDVGTYVITPTGDEIQGYYKVEYKNGSFEITVRQVILTGESATRTYTGQEIELTGIEQSGLLDGHTFSGVSYSAKGTNASATPYPGEFSNMDKLVIKDADGNDVTKNYKPEYALGALTINPIGTVTVTIKGKTVTGVYCGADYIAEGYDVEISDPKYTKDDFTFSGNSQVYRTDVGTTYMGLKAEQFENKNSNFDRVEFVIEEDGYVEVTKRPLYLRADTPNPITYDGAEHVRTLCVVVAKGEYLEIANGQMLENVLTMYRVSGTNVGIYKGEFLQLAKIVDRDDPSKDVTANYDIKYETGTLQITKMPITITAGSAEGAYILGPITSNEWKATATAEGDTVSSVKLTGAQTTLGESPNVASDAVIKNAKGEDVTANYEITYVDGLLKGIELLEKEIHFNYVIGYTDGTIRPGNNISRAEVATIFFRLLTDEAREQYNKTTTSYSDIKDGAWCCRAVATLTNAGVINGYTDGTFRPNAPITRAELATIIARFAKLDVNTKTFSDINGHWAQKNIELAAGNGWINGYEDGTFRPNNNITRAETFAMINRVLDRQTENVSDLLPTSEMNMWSDNMNENAWYYKDIQEATNYHKCDRVDQSTYEKWTEKVPDIDWASYQI